MMTAKKTNGGKTSAKKTTKKAISKKKRATETSGEASTANIPGFFPKYPGYRLSDIIATTEWRKDIMSNSPSVKKYVSNLSETLQEYVFRLFPNSIATQYLRKTKRVNDIDVLSNIVDEYVTSHKIHIPAEDVMVMHLRVGDVIDGTDVPVDDFFNRRVNSYYALFGEEPEGFSPVYVRCLASFDRALKKTKELGFHKISLVYGFHIKYKIQKSKKYIAYLAQYAQSQGFEVETITDADADVSFAYACCAKHFIPGGGGFSKLMAKVVRYKGNDVYYVKI